MMPKMHIMQQEKQNSGFYGFRRQNDINGKE